MANVTLNDITPQHLFESVRLLKSTPYRVYFSVNALEIRFQIPFIEPKETTDFRFDQMQHLATFLQELQQSSIPVDLGEFVKTYRKFPYAKYVMR